MTITLLLYNVKLSLFIFDHYGLHISLISVIQTLLQAIEMHWTDSVFG